MFDSAHAADDIGGLAEIFGGKIISGFIKSTTRAFAGDDEVGVNDGANERNTAFDGLEEAFLGVESEM